MTPQAKIKLDDILGYKFTTRSRQAATLNDFVSTLTGDEEVLECWAYIIANYKFIERTKKDVPLSKRDMTSDRWLELMNQHQMIFEAIIDTSFLNLPPVTEVARKFIAFLDKYTDPDEKDMLVALMLGNERVPYPSLPPVDALPSFSDEEFSAAIKNMYKKIRTVDFMIIEKSITSFASVAAVVISLIEDMDSFKDKQVFLTACFGRLQKYYSSMGGKDE